MAGIGEPLRELLHRRARLQQRFERGGRIAIGSIVVGRRVSQGNVPWLARQLLYRQSVEGGVDGRDGRTITCSRIGCDAPATASFSFDALNELAWLDTVVEARGAGFLCQVHAERLTPPRGWSLLDRRSPEPKLFVAPSVLPTAAGPKREREPKRNRATKARHAKAAPESSATPSPSKPSSGDTPTGAAAELPFDAPPPMPRTWSPRDLPALDDEFDDRTPMLARAFESLRQHEERKPGAQPGPESV